MPRPSPTQSRSLSQPKALEMFTDRVTQQEVVACIMAPLNEAASPSNTEFLTVFYGVGGVGKTTLCHKVLESCRQLHPGVAGVMLNLDCDKWSPSSGFAHLLAALVPEMASQGIPTPLTQALLLMYSHADAVARVPETSSDLWAGAFAVLDEAVGAAGIPGIGLAFKSVQWLKNRKQQADVKERLRDLGLWPEEPQGGRINLTDIQEKLAQALFEDLRLWAVPGKNLRILLDGFERIQSRERRRDCQQLLQQTAGYFASAADPALVGRIRLLVFGRERLKWDELFDDPGWKDFWTQHLLEGLGEADALDFIAKYSGWMNDHGEPEAAAAVLKHSPAILDAAAEHEAGTRSIYPHYLDLAVVMVCGASRTGGIPDLGCTPGELQDRFFRYLKPEELHLLKILALAETFDGKLFDALVRDHRVSGFAVGTFPSAVVEGRSYVVESGTTSFRFHRLMENALQDLWLKSDTERKQGCETAHWLLGSLEQQLSAAPRKDWGEPELDSWRRGIEILVTQGYERDLLILDECQERCAEDLWGSDFPVSFEMAEGFLWRMRQSLEKRLGMEHPDTLGALGELAISYGDAGRLIEALEIHEEVFRMSRDKFDSEHPHKLSAMTNLANSYGDVGRLGEALELHEEVFHLSREKLGANHPDTLWTMNNLANSYGDVGRLGEALVLREEVFRQRREKLGSEHPDTLGAMRNLANSYGILGRLEEALELRKEVLRLYRERLGDEHPDTLGIMSSLAYSYCDAGSLKEALELSEEVCRISRDKLGVEHPDTIIAMQGLAISYSSVGRLEEALELRKEALHLSRKKLGTEHPNTLMCQTNLAISYDESGYLEEATELREEGYRISRDKLGIEHPDTLNVMQGLAISYGSAGRLEEALELREEILYLSREKLGTEHPNTLNALSNLAVSYAEAGRMEETLEVEEEVLRLSRKKLGAKHPDTISAMSNLAISYGNAGRLEESLELEVEVLRLRREKLGMEHPDTISAMSNLAISYGEAARPEEEMEIRKEILCLRQEKLGMEHPDTLSAMSDLAISYSEAGRLEEALTLWEEVLHLSREKLGMEHPDTIRAMSNFAISYSEAGRLEEALLLREEVLSLRRKTFGSEHPDTLSAMSNLAISYDEAGRLEEEIELRQEILTLRRKTLGAEHRDTLDSAYFLATQLNLTGRRYEALQLLRDYASLSANARELVSYNLACYECLEGNEAAAKQLIARHLERNPDERDEAIADSDFASIRDWIAQLDLPTIPGTSEIQSEGYGGHEEAVTPNSD